MNKSTKSVPLSCLDTIPAPLEEPRECWQIFMAHPDHPTCHRGPMIDWFYCKASQDCIAKAKRLLKNLPDFYYGNFVLIDEENGVIKPFTHTLKINHTH